MGKLERFLAAAAAGFLASHAPDAKAQDAPPNPPRVVGIEGNVSFRDEVAEREAELPQPWRGEQRFSEVDGIEDIPPRPFEENEFSRDSLNVDVPYTENSVEAGLVQDGEGDDMVGVRWRRRN